MRPACPSTWHRTLPSRRSMFESFIPVPKKRCNAYEASGSHYFRHAQSRGRSAAEIADEGKRTWRSGSRSSPRGWGIDRDRLASTQRPTGGPPGDRSGAESRSEWGYVAHAPARSLRRGATSTIGLVIETDNAAAREGDNFFLAIADAMQDVLSRRGYDLVLLPTRHSAKPLDVLQHIVRRGTVDALILTATRRHDPRIELLLGARLPFLTLGRSETPGTYSWVDLDFEGVATEINRTACRLRAPRDRSRGATGDANLSHLYLQAATQALSQHGLRSALLAGVPRSEAGGVELLDRILDLEVRPTAVATCSEPVVMGLYLALAQAGLAAGRDLSVVSFRDNPQRRYLSPPPACFELSFDKLGSALGEAIVGSPPRPAARSGACADRLADALQGDVVHFAIQQCIEARLCFWNSHGLPLVSRAGEGPWDEKHNP